MSVSILTATLPERREMFLEAYRSAQAQTVDVKHLAATDVNRVGAGFTLNKLLEQVDTDWVMVLDDDDLLDPHHVETLLAHAEDADVIYSLPRVTGGRFALYELPFDARYFAKGINCVSHTALLRTEMVRQIGGWDNVRAFDLDLFRRLDMAGAEFRKVPEVTWTYRLHGANWSHGTLAGVMA